MTTPILVSEVMGHDPVVTSTVIANEDDFDYTDLRVGQTVGVIPLASDGPVYRGTIEAIADGFRIDVRLGDICADSIEAATDITHAAR